ncbi:Alpha-1 3/1 6-mannosyltransferase alg-2 [Apophysomyces sp. BC1034]|nr:Alpha-1 3/1 6-mannosyltransferase alg-2 [Apophysomyces sp. BC1021]KAG0175659.1 Alpha-1 3/1 6-mannosyltransferase alg-2 [Apophysomyces sp. BC1015]KAG0194728.1 Alpha-1 3/1 6-mannosyltransferase alg-2 [Apophysomyces sp. BC1034]
MSYNHPNYGSPYQQQASAQGYGAPPPGAYGRPVPPPPQGYGSPATPHQGGYPPTQNYGRPPPPQGPPPGADPQLWNWFRAVDADNSGQLTVDELQRALVNGDWSPFNIETVRTMVNMFDTDNTGTIDFNEFAGLWKYIEDWKKCFQTFDADGSGSIDRGEMQNALRTFGYNLSDRFVDVLIKTFDKYGKGDVTFDNFVQACVNVKTLTDSFRTFDTDNDGWIQFLELVIRQRA